ncbi:MAG: FAD-binding oxidoreductase [Caulobacterales bacterium]|uniref:FAD-binding oxidoreductase n=1 Tax=Glycocaulis sp. TaxID=1969725 RepID=UPI003FA062E3
MAVRKMTLDGLAARLEAASGVGTVSTDPARCALLSQDVWSKGETALAVVRPESQQAVAALLPVIAAEGLAAFPRGGGMSYTGGYTPDRPGIVVDLGALDRVLEINRDDMYVRVEAGCTWDTLYRALKPLGLRTPFWGPLSGISSTIGGGLSQNNAFFGAGIYGPGSDSVLSVTVALADGSLLRTGSAGTAGGHPFFRQYGPDLTGVFLGDCGALGFKTEATLRLIPMPEHEMYGSFAFADADTLTRAMSEVARANLASEVFGFDPGLARVRLKRASLTSDAKALAKVVTGQGGLLKGVAEGARMALAGRGFVGEADYTLHVVVEGRSKAGTADDFARLEAMAQGAGGKRIENTIPKVIRANPFTPLNNMLGPEGERWVPVHGIVRHSDAAACWQALEDAFAERQEAFARHSVQTGYLVTTLGTTGFLIEPVFLWPETLFALHEASVEKSWLDRLPRHADNPEASAVVAEARQAVIEVFSRFAAAHFQIGRSYPFAGTRSGPALNLLTGIKTALDPHNIINPGVLGLEAER